MLPIAWFLKLGLGQRLASLASWAVPIALILAAGAALWARGEHFRAEAAEATGAKEKAEGALVAQQEAYRAAAAKAVAQQTERARTIEAEQAKLKEQADNAYIEGLEDGRSRADRYAAANRCVRPESGGADPGGADAGGMSRASPAPGKPAGTGADADLVAISRADFDRCTAAAVRLDNAFDWARGYPGNDRLGN